MVLDFRMIELIGWVRRITLFLVLILMFSNHLFGQDFKELFPIEVKKSVFSKKYTYNGRSFSNPYGLEIPLMEINDVQVTKDFEVFKRARNVSRILGMVSAGFSLYSFFNRDEMPASTYWGALGTVGAVSAFFNIRSDVYFDRAVGRYNKIVSGTQIGVYHDRNQFGIGTTQVGFTYRF
jgi:hypothetical protein